MRVNGSEWIEKSSVKLIFQVALILLLELMFIWQVINNNQIYKESSADFHRNQMPTIHKVLHILQPFQKYGPGYNSIHKWIKQLVKSIECHLSSLLGWNLNAIYTFTRSWLDGCTPYERATEISPTITGGMGLMWARPCSVFCKWVFLVHTSCYLPLKSSKYWIMFACLTDRKTEKVLHRPWCLCDGSGCILSRYWPQGYQQSLPDKVI